ncbi:MULTISPECIES: histidine kinase [Nostoc]|uniref:Histidine kinase n=1 Tax=Nostoc paludosum FACHB-159 TaxID=2692908 RepID=A0ABR8K4Y7_9NOSO|nr:MULTISPECIES: histidine kinase [Nostoc]MBD2677812.1 histidine kinase [Nostoc sp. FACHB-857]MBD2734013.1 histidine kinase [Nostoc paludosum FACHB-159]
MSEAEVLGIGHWELRVIILPLSLCFPIFLMSHAPCPMPHAPCPTPNN